MLLSSILIGLIVALGQFDYQLGSTYLARPIVLSTLVGLVLGDVHSGIAIGAALELYFMGAVAVGAFIPPDVVVGGVLGTAFAIQLGSGTETALALAMPIAVLALALTNIIQAIIPIFIKHADTSASLGKASGIRATHWFVGTIFVVMKFTVSALAFYLGADAMQVVLNSIPQLVIDGMRVAASILPAMGFAMLMRMILNKKLLPFFFLGFVLAAYVKIPVLGVAIVGVIVAIEKLGILDGKLIPATNTIKEVDDDDF